VTVVGVPFGSHTEAAVRRWIEDVFPAPLLQGLVGVRVEEREAGRPLRAVLSFVGEEEEGERERGREWRQGESRGREEERARLAEEWERKRVEREQGAKLRTAREKAVEAARLLHYREWKGVRVRASVLEDMSG
jgi:hypothetical protein